ncbi:MAG: hypothetical protein WCX32_04255 [Clostridia bacterium]|nr:hypothetical protein [Clostridia bacterium]
MEKVGILEISEKYVKLMMATVTDNGYFVVSDEIEKPLNIGKQLSEDGVIKSGEITDLAKILKLYRRMCEINKITKLYGIVASSIKNAKNQRSFIEEINASAGINFKIITETEELNYIYTGIIRTMDIPKGLIMQVNDNSTSFILYNRRNILAQEMLPIGALTLSEMFGDCGLQPQEQCTKIKEYFITELKKLEWFTQLEPDYSFIGVGDIFSDMSKISRKVRRYPLDKTHNYNMSSIDFNAVYDIIKVLDLDKAKKLKGISEDRADTFASGLAMIKAVLEYINIENISVSAYGLREGALFNFASPSLMEKPINDVLGGSLATLVKFYEGEFSNADNVYNLSIILFRQLRLLHKLPRGYIKVLRIASSLHDAGLRISYYDHQKTCYNVILNSDIYGATHREIILGAFVASSQNSDDFNVSEWVRYKDIILEEDLEAVKKLSIIIKIAESLDRTSAGLIKDINCDVLGDSVIMKTIVDENSDASIEIMDATLAMSDFKKAYKKNLEIL